MPRPVLAIILLTLAGCGADTAALGPPRSTNPPFAINNRELEPRNSLPPGFTTANPIAPRTGNLNTVKVP